MPTEAPTEFPTLSPTTIEHHESLGEQFASMDSEALVVIVIGGLAVILAIVFIVICCGCCPSELRWQMEWAWMRVKGHKDRGSKYAADDAEAAQPVGDDEELTVESKGRQRKSAGATDNKMAKVHPDA